MPHIFRLLEGALKNIGDNLGINYGTFSDNGFLFSFPNNFLASGINLLLRASSEFILNFPALVYLKFI